MKKRLEDDIKSRFDSFEPEVDPGLWERISKGLENMPPGDDYVQREAGGTLQSFLKATWIKWGVAALLTGSILSGVILYLISTEKTVVPSTDEKIQMPTGDKQETSIEADTQGDEASPGYTSGHPEASQKTQEALNHEHYPQTEEVVTPAASGDQKPSSTAPEALIRMTPGVEPGKTNEESKKTDTGHPSVPGESKTAQPILIISAKRGFSPFMVTAMTTQMEQPAEYAFGDGTVIARNGSATHTYNRPGTYLVSCTIDGVKLEETIEVIGEIPTAFSPNGDGVNDIFIIDNQAGAQLDFRIFDRSGRLVFSRKGTVIEWNGTLKNGEDADAGTYLYDIFAASEGGITWKQKGTIHIFK